MFYSPLPAPEPLHIPDGFLTAVVSIIFWVLTVLSVGYALKRVNQDLDIRVCCFDRPFQLFSPPFARHRVRQHRRQPLNRLDLLHVEHLGIAQRVGEIVTGTVTGGNHGPIGVSTGRIRIVS